MAVPQHPMSALKGTQQARDLMAQVRAHRGGGTAAASPPTPTAKETTVADSKFIQGAIERPGALTAKAKAAGMSIDEFARAHQHDPGTTGAEARFYLNVLAKTPSGKKHQRTERDVARDIIARHKKPAAA